MPDTPKTIPSQDTPEMRDSIAEKATDEARRAFDTTRAALDGFLRIDEILAEREKTIGENAQDTEIGSLAYTLYNTLNWVDACGEDMLALVKSLQADNLKMREATTCYECETPLNGPYCPACNPLPSPEAPGWNEAIDKAHSIILDIVDGDFDGDLHYRVNQAFIALRRPVRYLGANATSRKNQNAHVSRKGDAK